MSLADKTSDLYSDLTPEGRMLARLEAAAEILLASNASIISPEAKSSVEDPEPDLFEAQGQMRFGLNSLIRRMTGGTKQSSTALVEAAHKLGTDQDTEGAPKKGVDRTLGETGIDDTENEDLNIEVPAFLRRQAN